MLGQSTVFGDMLFSETRPSVRRFFQQSHVSGDLLGCYYNYLRQYTNILQFPAFVAKKDNKYGSLPANI